MKGKAHGWETGEQEQVGMDKSTSDDQLSHENGCIELHWSGRSGVRQMVN